MLSAFVQASSFSPPLVPSCWLGAYLSLSFSRLGLEPSSASRSFVLAWSGAQPVRQSRWIRAQLSLRYIITDVYPAETNEEGY